MDIPGLNRSSQAMSGLRTLRDELATDKAQIDKTLGNMTAVVDGQGDLQPAMVTFTGAIADAKAARMRVLAKTEEMRAKARDYITGWEVEVYGVEDGELRKQAETRRNEVRANYGKVNESLKSARLSYEKFETALDDIQRFLANDLTKSGVAAAASSARKTADAGAELKMKMDGAIGELDRVSGEMTPAGPKGAPETLGR